MNRKRLWLRGAAALAAVLATVGLGSCSQEELGGGERLPEGEYPLEISSVTVDGDVQTRVVVVGKNSWSDNDMIGVRIGSGTVGKYTLNADGTVNKAYEPVFWQNTAQASVDAWYPYTTQTDRDISNQAEGFAEFDYLYAFADRQSYKNPVTLTFKHRMAKVSYTLTKGDGVTDDELNDATVSIAGHTKADFKKGMLSGTTDGWITSCYLPSPTTKSGEALVVPQSRTGKPLIKVSINDNDFTYTPAGTVRFKAGKNYQYNITVKRTGIEVTGCTITAWGNGNSGSGSMTWYDPDKVINLNTSGAVTISNSGKYLITGTGKNTVTISGGSPTIVLKDVNISDAYPPIEVTGSNPTFILEGNNTLSTKQGKGALYNVPGTTITIDGNGTLTANGAWNTAGIGAGTTSDFSGNSCGKIIIKGGTIYASGSGGAAAIGCGYWGNCEGIEILGGTVTAQTLGNYQNNTIASIGTGHDSSCTYVELAKCTIYSKLHEPQHQAIRATRVTPAYDNIAALKAAGVTIYVRDVLYTN